MTDKISSEDFIKAFGEGVRQMGNIKPIVIDCKYYLPCGRCDKTNDLCSQLGELVIPVKPNVTMPTGNPFYAPVDNGGVTPV